MASIPFRRSVDEARSIESSILKSRLVGIGTAAILFALLPWPGYRWLQVLVILLWLVQGIVAAAFVSRATRVEQVRISGVVLLSLDLAVLFVPILMYMPTLPEAWAGILILLLWGGARERNAGAIGVAVVATLFISAIFLFHLVGPAADYRLGRFVLIVGLIWLAVLAVASFVRTTSWRTEQLASQQDKLETALREQETMRARADIQASTLKKVTELAVSLLRERQLNAVLDRMLDVTMQSFGFRAGSLLIAQRESESYVYAAVRGYPLEIERELRLRRVPFALAELKTDKRFLIRPLVYYAPVERQTWYTDPSFCYDPDRVNMRRTEPGAWHEADTLIFALQSSSGEVIGLLIPDAPADGRVPAADTIDNIALFARLAAAAIENIHLVATEKTRANTLSEQNVEMKRLYSNVEALAEERRLQIDRLTRILEVSAAIFRERDLKTMLRRILQVATETFGFSAGTILLRDERRNIYVRQAAVGYPENVEGQDVSVEQMEFDMNPTTKVRETFYYVPAELQHSGGVSRHPDRLALPRIQPGDWHENDLLIFPIFDSAGNIIGTLSPDDPKDHRLPREETIRTIEVFAQLAGLAVESARLRTAANIPA
jgi:GAF domain-containing protein